MSRRHVNDQPVYFTRRQFICKHVEEFVRLHPRPTPLETPIEVSKETSNWYGRDYTTTQIKPIDNNSNP